MNQAAPHALSCLDTAGIPQDACQAADSDDDGLRIRAIYEQQRRNTDALSGLATQVSGLTSALSAIVQRLDEGAKRMDAMQTELAKNTSMTQTISDASTFVRVGTSVAKWLGVVAIAVGSVVVGVKMAAGGSMPPDVGIGPK